MNRRTIFSLISLFVFISACFSLSLSGSGIASTDINKDTQTEPEAQAFVDNQLIVKMTVRNSATPVDTDQEAGIDKAARKLSGDTLSHALLRRYPNRLKRISPARVSDYYIFETVENCDLESFSKELKQNPMVKDVSLNYLASFASVEPDDPYFTYQYALYNSGQVIHPVYFGWVGTAGSDIRATEGWVWANGGDSIIIAVIDSGVAGNHEDLAGKVLDGYNFVDDNANAYDDHGHGTLVASLAAANTNNGLGIAGVAWNAQIMPIKTMDSDGHGSYLAIGYGIRYAADHGAQVINLSIGGRTASFILEDAAAYAFEKGCVIVCSAGNTASPVTYPAAYDDYCLAVAATDKDDRRAGWSNYGPQIDVAAPGQDVVGATIHPGSPSVLDEYKWDSGTSYASPIVAGAAAVLMHYKPFLSNSEVLDLIKFTADDINGDDYPGIDDYLGYGRINLKTLLAPYQVKE